MYYCRVLRKISRDSLRDINGLRGHIVRGDLIEPFKNIKISTFSNSSQTSDLSSYNSYLNGTLFGFLKNFSIWPYFCLKSRIFDNYRSLVIFTSKNQSFTPKCEFSVCKHYHMHLNKNTSSLYVYIFISLLQIEMFHQTILFPC